MARMRLTRESSALTRDKIKSFILLPCSTLYRVIVQSCSSAASEENCHLRQKYSVHQLTGIYDCGIMSMKKSAI